ncbi:MAG: DUF4286 family protein [Deltaproteobacteria bacterium]|nr:DUF4286 family protein [Deltaproteobacteria bacterium]
MAPIFYNVFLTVDPTVEQAWRQWMIEVHIPDVLARPGFTGATMYIADPMTTGAEGGKAQYVNAYLVESREALEAYLKSPEAANFRTQHQEKFGKYASATRAVWTPVKQWK